jgi:hypothetical protein
MMKYVNGKYVNVVLTEEELARMEHEWKTHEAQEKHRPLTLDEVNSMLIKKQINTVEIDDQTSARMLDFYPTFEEVIGQTVTQGFKFTCKGKLFKVVQASLTISEVYPPEAGTESLYARIDEVHDGDIYDPIPYEGNMALENGKYYTQGGATYLCNRDTGNPVYNALSELVGLYVEVVS